MLVKTDCAAWDTEHHGCKALKKLLCYSGKCPFYKTKAKVELDNLMEKQRFERVSGVHLDPPVEVAIAPAVGSEPQKRTYVKGKSEEQKKTDRSVYLMERRKRLIEEGRCPICGKENDRAGDKTLCTPCAKRHSKLRMESRERKKRMETCL